MATKFLDKTGLSHFWNKIKAWCNSLFALDSTVVHKTGNETIAGTKTFSSTITGSVSGNAGTATKLATARSLWGNNFNGSAAVTGVISGTPAIEFKPASNTANHGGYIDFHYNQSTSDYTSRIIESASGTISINNVTVNGSTITGSLSGNASSATEFSAAKSVTLTGDITGTASSKAGWSVATTLANSGVTAGTYGNTSQQTPSHGGTFNIPYYTVDAKGRVTVGGTTTVKLPTDSNTDTLMTQNVSTTNATYPLLAVATANATANLGAKTGIFGAGVKINPSDSKLIANYFVANGMDGIRFRQSGSNKYTSLIRNDGSSTYWLLTNANDPDGTWNSLRPLTINNATGACSISGNAATASAVAWSGVTGKPTTIAGYGITDAKIADGTITIGSNSITPLTSVSSHNQASNTINAMTGYSKPNSGSAIATSDSLNSAIGKLEAKVDAYDDSNYVHKTNDESIAGIKKFPHIAAMTMDCAKEDVSSDFYCGLYIVDNTATFSDVIQHSKRFGRFECSVDTNNLVGTWISAYKNDSSGSNATLLVGYDTNNDIRYATAPSTSSIRTNGTDILTRDWIPNDTRIVHTTGNENIDGKKLFTGPELIIKHAVTKGTPPSSTQYRGFYFVDSNGTLNAAGHDRRFGKLESVVYNNGDVGLWLTVYKNAASATNSASLIIYWDSTNNIGVANAPSTSTARTNGTDIVTRDWIPKDTRIVHTTDAERIDGQKTFLKSLYVESAAQSNAWAGIRIKNMGTDRSIEPSQAYWPGDFALMDKNDNILFSLSRYADAVTQELIISSYSQGSSSSAGAVHLNWNKNKGLHSFYPDLSNAMTLGESNHLWKEIFARNTAISSSDERLKSSISSVPDEVLDAWENVNFVQYQFNDAISEKGSSARFHNGLIAQNIDRIFKANNLDASKYGLFCYDEWDAEPERKDENGNVVRKATPAGNRYSLRYTEVLCMEATYQRRKNKILENRISDLETQVQNMLQILESFKGA